MRPCGTLAAYRRHLRHGETPCAECRQANADADRDERQAPGSQAIRAAPRNGLPFKPYVWRGRGSGKPVGQ